MLEPKSIKHTETACRIDVPKLYFNEFRWFSGQVKFQNVLQIFFISKSFTFSDAGGASVGCGAAPAVVWGLVLFSFEKKLAFFVSLSQSHDVYADFAIDF